MKKFDVLVLVSIALLSVLLHPIVGLAFGVHYIALKLKEKR